MAIELRSELEEIEGCLVSLQEKIDQLVEEKRTLEDRKELIQVQLQSLDDVQTYAEIATLQSIDWENGHFPWTDQLNSTLNSTFSLSSFRPLQLSCMNAVLSKKDVILIMPTGGGKSLCYQLPAVICSGFTLVISPLVSLMEDQLMAVKRNGIPSHMLNASSTRQQVTEVYSNMIDKKDQAGLKLVYVTPEKVAKSKRFMSKLEKAYEIGRLACIVIDEVHCASQWGHDFRPDYKILGILKRQFPESPIMGLTATATAKVLEDCKSILNLKTCLVFKASYNRPNLFYEVKEKPSSHKEQVKEIVDLIKKDFHKQSGIIYCFSQKDAQQLCLDLCTNGINAGCYHGNMTAADRTKVHTLWTTNKIQVIVATVAFGMGIDKGDVRFVFHHSLSKSMENYYQESGRAGRDGQPAVCILYYKMNDVFRQSTMVMTEHTGLQNLYSMLRYCLNRTKCRRALVAQHFGEKWKESDCQGMCDVCQCSATTSSSSSSKTTDTYWEEDVTLICQGFLEILDDFSSKTQHVTALKLVELWKTSKVAKSNEFSKAKPSVIKLERILIHCLLENILKEYFHFTPYNTISYIVTGRRATAVRSNRIRVTRDMSAGKSAKKICKYPTLTLSEMQRNVLSERLTMSGIGSITGLTRDEMSGSSTTLDERPSNTSLTGSVVGQDEAPSNSSVIIEDNSSEDEMEILGKLKKRLLPSTGDFEDDDFITERTPKRRCSGGKEKEKVSKSMERAKGNRGTQKKTINKKTQQLSSLFTDDTKMIEHSIVNQNNPFPSLELSSTPSHTDNPFDIIEINSDSSD